MDPGAACASLVGLAAEVEVALADGHPRRVAEGLVGFEVLAVEGLADVDDDGRGAHGHDARGPDLVGADHGDGDDGDAHLLAEVEEGGLEEHELGRVRLGLLALLRRDVHARALGEDADAVALLEVGGGLGEELARRALDGARRRRPLGCSCVYVSLLVYKK